MQVSLDVVKYIIEKPKEKYITTFYVTYCMKTGISTNP